MLDCINYPNSDFKDYIEFITEYCTENELSLILKGSLANGSATKHSDIDLIVLGNITSSNMDEIISNYNIPVITNFTEKPRGIFILVYKNGLCIDLDVRQTILQSDVDESIILQKFDKNFIISEKIIRSNVQSSYLPNRPDWYKILRLIHRGIIKQLCNKRANAELLLSEIKEGVSSLGICKLNYNDDFKHDIGQVFRKVCNTYNVNSDIKILFNTLLNEL